MNKKIELESFENIPEYTGLEKNSTCVTFKDGYIWEGDRYGTWVGRVYEDGESILLLRRTTVIIIQKYSICYAMI